MSDPIERQDAIDALLLSKKTIRRALDDIKDFGSYLADIEVAGIDRERYLWGLKLIESNIEDIKKLPPAQAERKKGKWIITSEFEDCYYAKCNQCNITQVFYFNKQLTNFCPNCGADMRGKE